ADLAAAATLRFTGTKLDVVYFGRAHITRPLQFAASSSTESPRERTIRSNDRRAVFGKHARGA
ncbi:hypothetical protein TSAR_003034, partial [Trichomalopsis sarcophagae]